MAVIVEPSDHWVTTSRENPVTWPLFSPELAGGMAVSSMEIRRYACDFSVAVEQLSTIWREAHSRRFQDGILVVPPHHFTFPNSTGRLSFIKNPVGAQDVLPGHPELDFLTEEEGVFTSLMASRFTSHDVQPAIRHLVSEPSALLLTHTPGSIPTILSSYQGVVLKLVDEPDALWRSFVDVCARLLKAGIIDAFVIGSSAFDDPYSLDTFERSEVGTS